LTYLLSTAFDQRKLPLQQRGTTHDNISLLFIPTIMNDDDDDDIVEVVCVKSPTYMNLDQARLAVRRRQQEQQQQQRRRLAQQQLQQPRQQAPMVAFREENVVLCLLDDDDDSDDDSMDNRKRSAVGDASDPISVDDCGDADNPIVMYDTDSDQSVLSRNGFESELDNDDDDDDDDSSEKSIVEKSGAHCSGVNSNDDDHHSDELEDEPMSLEERSTRHDVDIERTAEDPFHHLVQEMDVDQLQSLHASNVAGGPRNVSFASNDPSLGLLRKMDVEPSSFQSKQTSKGTGLQRFAFASNDPSVGHSQSEDVEAARSECESDKDDFSETSTEECASGLSEVDDDNRQEGGAERPVASSSAEEQLTDTTRDNFDRASQNSFNRQAENANVEKCNSHHASKLVRGLQNFASTPDDPSIGRLQDMNGPAISFVQTAGLQQFSSAPNDPCVGRSLSVDVKVARSESETDKNDFSETATEEYASGLSVVNDDDDDRQEGGAKPPFASSAKKKLTETTWHDSNRAARDPFNQQAQNVDAESAGIQQTSKTADLSNFATAAKDSSRGQLQDMDELSAFAAKDPSFGQRPNMDVAATSSRQALKVAVLQQFASVATDPSSDYRYLQNTDVSAIGEPHNLSEVKQRSEEAKLFSGDYDSTVSDKSFHSIPTENQPLPEYNHGALQDIALNHGAMPAIQPSPADECDQNSNADPRLLSWRDSLDIPSELESDLKHNSAQSTRLTKPRAPKIPCVTTQKVAPLKRKSNTTEAPESRPSFEQGVLPDALDRVEHLTTFSSENDDGSVLVQTSYYQTRSERTYLGAILFQL
jgi:hypothetical protein